MVVGLPSASRLGFFRVDLNKPSATILKWVTLDFIRFACDDLLTNVVGLNNKNRNIELYAVEWDFDTSKLKAEYFDKLGEEVIKD